MKPPEASIAVISASFAPKDSLAHSAGSGSIDIIFIRHLSIFFILGFFFLGICFGAVGFWEKNKTGRL